MGKQGKWLMRIADVIIISGLACGLGLYKQGISAGALGILCVLFAVINIIPAFYTRKIMNRRLRICQNGCELLYAFLASTVLIIMAHVLCAIFYRPAFSGMSGWKDWLFHILLIILVENIVFWNGIIRVYATSAQLGMKWRILGVVCGFIPIVHLIALGKILQVAGNEVKAESEKNLLNHMRKEEQICATRYPILLVHGVFFRDFRYFNYWGRIPKQLEDNGAKVYYGNQQSAASVAECGQELVNRIKEIIKETGCEKINIIAHSKGGLDSRYAISMLGADEYVASLTTINTPHRGCEFADYLLSKVSESQKQAIAKAYNTALKELGDKSPDFLAAVTDLTASACEKMNEKVKDSKSVYYQSVGSKLNVARGGRFPLNLTNLFVKYFDGNNDGLVGEKSFPWGENYRFLTVKGKRGISHGDMIDLNRENFKGFDIREFYVQLAAELKDKGF